jgi:hypothetical protein
MAHSTTVTSVYPQARKRASGEIYDLLEDILFQFAIPLYIVNVISLTFDTTVRH